MYPPRYPKRKKKRISRLPLLFIAFVIVLIIAGLIWHSHRAKAPEGNTSGTSSANTTAPSFDKTKYSVNNSESLWVVVNKGRILPSNYVPPNLVVPNVPLRLNSASQEMHVRQDTASAMQQMFAAADQQSIHLMLASGYRSYSFQVSLYNGYVRTQGQAAADRSSARPGHSEHQTGLAADLEPASRKCEVEECFADTPEGQWLAANCYKYGFIIRYTKDQENLTGYEYEPWHIRYVGTDLAQQIHQSGQTLEQFFNLPIYADYPASPYQLK